MWYCCGASLLQRLHDDATITTRPLPGMHYACIARVLQQLQPNDDRLDARTPLRMVGVRLNRAQAFHTTIDFPSAGNRRQGVAPPLVAIGEIARLAVEASPEDVEVVEWGRCERKEPTAILHVLQMAQDPHGHRTAIECLLGDGEILPNARTP